MTLIMTLLACSSTNKDQEDTSTVVNSTDEPSWNLNAELLFTVPNRPWDISGHEDGSLFCSAQTGGQIYEWDDETQERSELPEEFNDILAIGFDGDTLFYSTTSDTNTGALLKWDGIIHETITTQSEDGTLIRWPVDISAGPQQDWFIADYNAGVVFHVDSTGFTQTIGAGTSQPTAVFYHSNMLYIGGDDGVYERPWPNGTTNKIDDRAAAGFTVISGKLIASGSPTGLFTVGGEELGFDGPARFGAMLYLNEQIYVADRIGEGIWVATP
jgi:hypothetical protein